MKPSALGCHPSSIRAACSRFLPNKYSALLRRESGKLTSPYLIAVRKKNNKTVPLLLEKEIHLPKIPSGTAKLTAQSDERQTYHRGADSPGTPLAPHLFQASAESLAFFPELQEGAASRKKRLSPQPLTIFPGRAQSPRPDPRCFPPPLAAPGAAPALALRRWGCPEGWRESGPTRLRLRRGSKKNSLKAPLLTLEKMQ